MQDETRKLQEEARRFWEKAVGYLKTVPHKVDETVRKTAESSVLRMEIVSQRRELDQGLKELGRRVHDLVRLQGAVTAEEISLAVEKVTVIEGNIAEKERRIAELDVTGAAPESVVTEAHRVTPEAPSTAKKAARKTTTRKKTPSRASKTRPSDTKAGKKASKKAPAAKKSSKKTAAKPRSVARKSPKK